MKKLVFILLVVSGCSSMAPIGQGVGGVLDAFGTGIGEAGQGVFKGVGTIIGGSGRSIAYASGRRETVAKGMKDQRDKRRYY